MLQKNEIVTVPDHPDCETRGRNCAENKGWIILKAVRMMESACNIHCCTQSLTITSKCKKWAVNV